MLASFDSSNINKKQKARAVVLRRTDRGGIHR